MILSLEQRCAPLALCQKLKALGAPQDGLWCWAASTTWINPADHLTIYRTPPAGDDSLMVECAAYTVAELGEMLWPGIAAGHTMPALFLPPVEPDRTWADALAGRLIALAETGIVKWQQPGRGENIP